MGAVLKDLDITEISLCFDPASPGARVALFKSASSIVPEDARGVIRKALEDEHLPDEVLDLFDSAIEKANAAAPDFNAMMAAENKARAVSYVMQDVSAMTYALGDALRAIYASDEDDKTGLANTSVDQFVNAVKGSLQEIEDGGGAEGEDEEMDVLHKAKTPADPDGDGIIENEAEIDPVKDKGKKKKDGSWAVKKANGDADLDGLSPVMKSGSMELVASSPVAKSGDVDGLVREAVTKALAAQQSELTDLRTTVSKQIEERKDADRTALAKSLTDGVPHVTVEQCVSVLKAIEGNEAALEGYKATLNATRIARQLDPIGVDGVAKAAGTVQERLDTAINARIEVAKSAGKSMSRDAAMSDVLSANPALYDEYKAARRANNAA